LSKGILRNKLDVRSEMKNPWIEARPENLHHRGRRGPQRKSFCCINQESKALGSDLEFKHLHAITLAAGVRLQEEKDRLRKRHLVAFAPGSAKPPEVIQRGTGSTVNGERLTVNSNTKLDFPQNLPSAALFVLTCDGGSPARSLVFGEKGHNLLLAPFRYLLGHLVTRGWFLNPQKDPGFPLSCTPLRSLWWKISSLALASGFPFNSSNLSSDASHFVSFFRSLFTVHRSRSFRPCLSCLLTPAACRLPSVFLFFSLFVSRLTSHASRALALPVSLFFPSRRSLPCA